MKKKVLAFLLCTILCASSMIGCSSESNNNVNSGTESGSGSEENNEAENETHNTTKYINDSENKSVDKLAFICDNSGTRRQQDNVVVTIDYKDIMKEEFQWDDFRITNGTVELNDYYNYYIDVWVIIDGISYQMDVEHGDMSEYTLITSDGHWYLYDGNMEGAYQVVYKITEREYNNCSMLINIFGMENDDAAKAKFDTLKSMINVYLADDSSYVDVIDVDENPVSLEEYHFAQDIVADLMKTECSMNIADSHYIYNIEDGEIKLEIPNETVELVDYEIEIATSVSYDEEDLVSTFDLNGNEVKMYNYLDDDYKKFCVKLGEEKYLKITCEFEDMDNYVDGMHQQLFIEHFQ